MQDIPHISNSFVVFRVHSWINLQTLQHPRYPLYPFQHSFRRRAHQSDTEVALAAFTEAGARGYHHALSLHQQGG